jgi:hypothetical protein
LTSAGRLEKKRVLASDLDTVMVDSLKALDLSRPIREADIGVHRPRRLVRRIRENL